MAKRLAIFLAAILLVAVGATATYFAISVPRDVEAQKLLKDARLHLKNGKLDEARESYQAVVQKYPRTDAAAAAITALFRMNDQERLALQRQLAGLEKARQSDRTRIGNVEKLAVEISKRPPPAPPKPTVTKATPKKKTPTKRTTSTTRRRRR